MLAEVSMATLHNGRDRFDLVTAAHHFVLTALPLRHPDSHQALDDFVAEARTSGLVAAEVDAVLLRVLSVLDPFTGGRLPSLVDRYLAAGRHVAGSLKRFQACIQDVLRYRSIGDAAVQRAIAIIEQQYTDPHLTQGHVADCVGLAPAQLAVRFKMQTSRTFGEYLRHVRLSRGGTLLAQTDKRIKEIWVEIGYNHGSNFDHDFKREFRVSPREYRARVIRPGVAPVGATDGTAPPHPAGTTSSPAGVSVLIVDDDEITRQTIARYLSLEGHTAFVAPTGREGLDEAERLEPDVVLLDYHLPDMDGLEWLRQLRRRPSTRPPAVVIFTADWEVEHAAAEIHTLGGTIASKLCDLDEIVMLIAARGASQSFGNTTNSLRLPDPARLHTLPDLSNAASEVRRRMPRPSLSPLPPAFR
jgi:two-component system, chemotaxis family, chemotaxis protein CheY